MDFPIKINETTHGQIIFISTQFCKYYTTENRAVIILFLSGINKKTRLLHFG